MNEDELKQGRRSTRLSISIPVVISGQDADGNTFTESVHTLVVNRHGGKIATAHHLAMGGEISVENLALGVMAKASVVWLGKKHYPGEIHHVGLQLLEAQNVWGIAFPPDDWQSQQREEEVPEPEAEPASETQPASEPDDTAISEAHISSLAGEEITIRLLQELQESADAHALEFKDRLKQLTHRLGLELEFELRERIASAKAHEVGALEEEINVFAKNLSAARDEVAKIEARIEELKRSLDAATANAPAPPPTLQEARHRLTAMTNSAIDSMNRAAEEGLNQYRIMLQNENQESAARRRAGPEDNPSQPHDPTTES